MFPHGIKEWAINGLELDRGHPEQIADPSPVRKIEGYPRKNIFRKAFGERGISF